MIYKIEFQYKPEGQKRPYDYVQEEELLFENGEFIPIPNVGDSIAFKDGRVAKAGKVISRHFFYMGDVCGVNIVYTDISDEDLSARIKE